MPTYTYTPKINGAEFEPGAVVEVDGDTATLRVESNVLVEGFEADGKWYQGQPVNGAGEVVLPLGKYWKVCPVHAGGLAGCRTSFELRKKAATPVGSRGASPVVKAVFATSPRPTFAAGGWTMVKNLDRDDSTVDGIDITAGGETVAPDGTRYRSAGYGYQISAHNCKISNSRIGTFSEYFLYVRPGIRNAVIEHCEIKGGTNFEASIRNAGGQLTLRNVTVIQDHTGIDNKRSRTLVRGYGIWTIEDSIFAGGAFGLTPMSRTNAGQDLGFGEFQYGRGSGNPITSEGGQIVTGNIMAGVQAAIDARAAGKSRRDIVKAAIAGAGIVGYDVDKLADDTLWNRDRMLGQRSTATIRNCAFDVSPDGVPVTVIIQAGTDLNFVDCDFHPSTIFKIEMAYPEKRVDPTRHPTNDDWVLPGDTVRPVPKCASTDCKMGGAAFKPFPEVSTS